VSLKGRKAHSNCGFGGSLHIECRYCGFVDTVQDDDALTPRKLAAPAAMHRIDLDESREGGVNFRGVEFIVDICGERAMIILVRLNGVLDLCAEMFEGQAMPENPTNLSTRLSSVQTEGLQTCGTTRQLQDAESER
jgi:hypothetical protein